MRYQVNLEGFEGQDIEAVTSFWSGPKLLVNGQRVPKGARRGEMLLQANNGREVVARWRPQLMGLEVPPLVVDDQVIHLVEPLKWYQWVWGGLPMALVFLGGALGAIAGVIALTLNLKIFRTEMNSALKYVLTGGVSILAVIVYLIVATIFTLLLQGS